MANDWVIALAQLNFRVGAVVENAEKIIHRALEARDKLGARLVLFPELAISGYPAEDLLLRGDFLSQCEQALQWITRSVSGIDVLVGHPARRDGRLFNSASYVRDGKVLACYDKKALPNYLVFDEKRYFQSGDQACVVEVDGLRAGITICEDLWEGWPLHDAAAAGAEIILNINASPYTTDKRRAREQLLQQHSSSLQCPIVYINLLGGQDELVFDGGSMCCSSQGEIVQRCPEFEEGVYPVVLQRRQGVLTVRDAANSPPLPELAGLYQALQMGLKDYVAKSRFDGVLLGLSGGIDSALVLALAVDALGPQHVEAVMMPSRYTSDMSLTDAQAMANALGVQYHVISIEPMFQAFLQELSGLLRLDPEHPKHVAAENIQARCRGVILMAMSNRSRKLVLATGNKSEMAVGYATLYGDMVGAYAPIKDVKKTVVYDLARHRNSVHPVIPLRVIERAPSAELAPGQTDQDSLPEYEILDRIITAYVENDTSVEEIVASGIPVETVRRVVGMIVANEYKRRQSAPGVRVTKRAFGKDRRYPIVNGFVLDGRSI